MHSSYGRSAALFAGTDGTIESLDLNETIREVVALSMSEVQRREVVLRLRFADDLPRVEGDRIQLQQVVLNLIKNAVDSMSTLVDGPRQLVISTETTASDVSVEVADSGPGVDPTKLGHVFEAFYSTKPGGLGVGLSICRAIIDAHHGKLSVTQAVPHGVVFRFTLPVSASAVTER